MMQAERFYIIYIHPILPKSSKYLLRRCLEPQKAFSGGVWGSKHPLRRYLEDYRDICFFYRIYI